MQKKRNKERFCECVAVEGKNMNWSNWVRLLERKKKDYETTREWSWAKQQKNNLQFVELSALVVLVSLRASLKLQKVGKFSSQTQIRGFISWNFLFTNTSQKFPMKIQNFLAVFHAHTQTAIFCVFFLSFSERLRQQQLTSQRKKLFSVTIKTLSRLHRIFSLGIC